MSHFIANTISISKDRLTYKLKGGDNNITPRSNSWTQDIPIKHLYSEINSGNVNLMDKSEKGCLVNNLCMNDCNYNKMYVDNSWDIETDYFHLNSLFQHEDGKELLKKRLEPEHYNLFDESYRGTIIETAKNLLKNFDKLKKQYNDFNAEFLRLLNERLDQMKETNKNKYVLYTNTYNAYITKITQTSFRYSTYDIKREDLERFCKIYGHHRSLFEIARFKSLDLVMILIY